MKRIFLRSLSVAFVTLLIFSCSNDDNADAPVSEPAVNDLFSVQDANLLLEGFPSASSEASLEVISMNTHVIPGGTAYATIETTTAARKLFIGAVGRTGYFELTPTGSSELTQNFILKINQLNREQNFTVRMAYLDGNNQISQTVFVDLLVVTVGTGMLQVNLSFNNDKDVDLHLIEPNGDHIYYGNDVSANGGYLDLDSNPGCSIDGVNNENIFYPEGATLEIGTYYVYVDMFENCDDSIATNFVTSVYLNGVEIPTSTQNPFSGSFPVGFPSNFGGGDIANNIAPVFSFEITEAISRHAQNAKKFSPQPLKPSAKMKLEKSRNL